MLKAILFDLDGTLLPMDQDAFVGGYFRMLAKKLEPYGFDPKTLIDGVLYGVSAMIKNDGSKNNEAAFWSAFSSMLGSKTLMHKSVFDEFYAVDFQQAVKFCGKNPQSAQTVASLKAKNYRLVLATNPVFPAVATESRAKWAGLNPDDFALITTYENSFHSKPNPAYYEDILKMVGCDAGECLMVGNDVDEDMVAKTLGMKVFLLTDCLINKQNADISEYPSGGFDELSEYIAQLG